MVVMLNEPMIPGEMRGSKNRSEWLSDVRVKLNSHGLRRRLAGKWNGGPTVFAWLPALGSVILVSS